jgi:hypothetical protein
VDDRILTAIIAAVGVPLALFGYIRLTLRSSGMSANLIQ